jgi:hypothetical protein
MRTSRSRLPKLRRTRRAQPDEAVALRGRLPVLADGQEVHLRGAKVAACRSSPSPAMMPDLVNIAGSRSEVPGEEAGQRPDRAGEEEDAGPAKNL